MDAWNHNSYCVPPEHVDRLCEAIEALFPWSLIVRKPHLVGYRLGDDLNRGALYLRPMAPARALFSALTRLRGSDPGLSLALDAMEAQDPDLGDHQGVRIASVEEWEQRVRRARALATERPELDVTVVRVERPGDAGALNGLSVPGLDQARTPRAHPEHARDAVARPGEGGGPVT